MQPLQAGYMVPSVWVECKHIITPGFARRANAAIAYLVILTSGSGCRLNTLVRSGIYARDKRQTMVFVSWIDILIFIRSCVIIKGKLK